MNEKQFLNELNGRLASLDSQERKNLLAEYQAHFAIGKEHGKSEEEIAFDLGDMDELVADIYLLKDEQFAPVKNNRRKYWLIGGLILVVGFLVVPFLLMMLAFFVLSV